MRRILLALCALIGSFALGGQVAHADTSCAHGHDSRLAWSICFGMPTGFKQRVRGHVAGIFGGYVYGNWYGNGVQSQAFHSGIDSEVTQLCAGAGCP